MECQEVLFVVNRDYRDPVEFMMSDYEYVPHIPTIYQTDNIYGFWSYVDNALEYVRRCNQGKMLISILSVWGIVDDTPLDLSRIVPYTGTTLWGWVDERGYERLSPLYPKNLSWQKEDTIIDLSYLLNPVYV